MRTAIICSAVLILASPLAGVAFGAALMRLWDTPVVLLIAAALGVASYPLLARLSRPNPWRRD